MNTLLEDIANLLGAPVDLPTVGTDQRAVARYRQEVYGNGRVIDQRDLRNHGISLHTRRSNLATAVSEQDRYALVEMTVDRKVKLLTEFKYDHIWLYSPHWIQCQMRNQSQRPKNHFKIGFLDTRGVEVVPPIFDDAVAIPLEDIFGVENQATVGFEPLFVLKIQGYCFLVTKKGKLISDRLYTNIRVPYDTDMGVPFSEIENKEYFDIRSPRLYLPAERNGKYGYINVFGHEVIPPQYNMAYGFSEYSARVLINDVFYLIDPFGNKISRLKDEDTEPYE